MSGRVGAATSIATSGDEVEVGTVSEDPHAATINEPAMRATTDLNMRAGYADMRTSRYAHKSNLGQVEWAASAATIGVMSTSALR
jgi:hypothetical protein